MKLVDKVLCIVMGVLAIANLVLEFIPGIDLARMIVAGVTGVYALGCMIYFGITKKETIKRLFTK